MVNGVRYPSEDFVFVTNEFSIERLKASKDKIPPNGEHKTMDGIARILIYAWP